MLAIGVYAVNLALHQHVVLSDVDLVVYRDAGLAASRSPGQLYSWQLSPGVQFTYTPFAAFCVLISVLPWGLVAWALLAGSAAALLQTVWLALGALGWAGTARLGVTAAVSAVASAYDRAAGIMSRVLAEDQDPALFGQGGVSGPGVIRPERGFSPGRAGRHHPARAPSAEM